MWKNVSLRLILKDKGGKQHCLLVYWIRELRHLFTLCIGVSRKFHAKPVYFLIVITCKRKSDLKEICAEKICFKFFKNKLAKLISSDIKKNCSKPFSHTSSNSLDIEEEVTKQINTLKPFDMEPRKVIPQKHFVSEK